MKTSFFKISTPLLKENMRRFWPIPVLSFLAYFIFGVFPILASYSRINQQALLIDSILDNTDMAFAVIGFATPVLASVAVFYYLKNTSAVTVMHSMPYTRRTLFTTNALSGFILTIVPIMVIGILLLCIAKPTYMLSDTYSGSRLFMDTYEETDSTVNLFSIARILCWVWQSLLLAFAVYALSTLAGMITGNSPMHLFVAVLLNGLGAGFGLSILAYLEYYLNGFVMTDGHLPFLYMLSPITGILSQHGEISAGLTITYFLFGLAVLVLSGYCYKKRRLERTTQSFVFQLIAPINCVIITFLGMTLCGFIFMGNGVGDEALTNLGFAGGTIVAFLISRVIVKKSLHIFNMQSLKNFVVYLVLAGAFLLVLGCDLTGYETKVPAVSEIKSVSINGFDMDDYSSMFNREFARKGNGITASTLSFSNKDTKSAVAEFHRQALKEKMNRSGDYSYANLTFDYILKNGKKMERSYWVDAEFLQNSNDMKILYESSEFKSFYDLSRLQLGKRYTFTLNSPFCTDLAAFKPSEYESLISCLNKDFMNSTYEQQISQEKPLGIVAINFDMKNSVDEFSTVSINVRKTDVHTMEWLKKHDYAQLLTISPEDISSITISESSDETGMVDGGKTIEIKDVKQIDTVMKACQTSSGPYDCTFNFKHESKYYMRGNIVYLDEKNAPDFIKEQLK